MEQVDGAEFILGKVALLDGHATVVQALPWALTHKHGERAIFATAPVAALHLRVKVGPVARTKQAVCHLLQIAHHLGVFAQVLVGSRQPMPLLIAWRHQRVNGSLEAVQRQARRGIKHLLIVLAALAGVAHRAAKLHPGRVDAFVNLLPHRFVGLAHLHQPGVLG